MFFSYRVGATWSTPAPVAQLLGTDQSVQVATFPNGDVMAAWLHTDGKDIYNIYTSIWNGSSWSTPTIITTATYVECLSFAYAHNQMLLVWSQKLNNNSSTYEDLTLFDATWQANQWSTPRPMGKTQSITQLLSPAALANTTDTSFLSYPNPLMNAVIAHPIHPIVGNQSRHYRQSATLIRLFHPM